MAPPEGSIFDPAKKWEEEKARRLREQETQADAEKEAKAAAKKKGGGYRAIWNYDYDIANLGLSCCWPI